MASAFIPGQRFDLGLTVLSEEDIISFAKAFDPLDFHTDKGAAEKSFFKGLVASGPHIFTLVHRTQWIPLFGKTVLAGLGVDKWRFFLPVYPGKKILSAVTVQNVKANPEKKHAAVTWFYEFKNEEGALVQSLEMTVLHKID